MNWKPLRHRLEFFVFRLLVAVVQAMTVRQSVRFAKGLAFIFTRVLPRKLTRYHVAAENLRTAFGDDLSDRDVERLVYEMWVHLFRVVAEIVQLPRKLRLENCRQVLTFPQSAWTVRTMCSGRPVLVLSGHFGNWEVANAAFGMFGYSMGVVARDLDNPYLHDWFARFRKHTGHLLISKHGGGTPMTQYMEHHGTLGLLGDQDAGPRGLFVDFFGRPASTFKSIALMAMQYRALIMVGYTRRLPDDFDASWWTRFEMGVVDVIDPDEFQNSDAVERITQRYTRAIERAIRLSPEQYFWVHRRWKSKPRVRKSAKRGPSSKAA